MLENLENQWTNILLAISTNLWSIARLWVHWLGVDGRHAHLRVWRRHHGVVATWLVTGWWWGELDRRPQWLIHLCRGQRLLIGWHGRGRLSRVTRVSFTRHRFFSLVNAHCTNDTMHFGLNKWLVMESNIDIIKWYLLYIRHERMVKLQCFRKCGNNGTNELIKT